MNFKDWAEDMLFWIGELKKLKSRLDLIAELDIHPLQLDVIKKAKERITQVQNDLKVLGTHLFWRELVDVMEDNNDSRKS